MTQEEIIEMARQAGLGFFRTLETDKTSVDALERFFHMAQAAEREACAKLCDWEWNGDADTYEYSIAVNDCAATIRARGE